MLAASRYRFNLKSRRQNKWDVPIGAWRSSSLLGRSGSGSFSLDQDKACHLSTRAAGHDESHEAGSVPPLGILKAMRIVAAWRTVTPIQPGP